MEGVLRQVDRASAIILQMRVFGRTPTEQPAPIDVETVIQGVILMVAPQFELDGTDVELAVKKRDVRVEALSVQFEQVLLNVLINANDSIRARHASGDSAGGLIKITVDRTASTAVINIDDNGTGLPDDVLPMLFEPFFTTKAPKEGTGLGLSISYGIIRDLGGSIRAQNGATGAQFTIELPLAPVETDKKARATKPGATAARIGKA
jgi:histidine kinase